MKKLKVGVIGTGRLGSIHARIYKENPACVLAAVCDTDQARMEQASQNFAVCGFLDYSQLLGKVDAVSIAVPTSLHHKVALFFLEHSIPALVEKPFTATLREADNLINFTTTKSFNEVFLFYFNSFLSFANLACI